ncbi:CPBP family intramembrane glutamic endopeptidase [Luedemannella helvata]|uniref:CPBP family glutamic-type intramembrane protease n=1 Tax=Luedemannella helvata TaxID=349315 RepID=A0ABP4X8J2_9ACTN
MTPLIRTRINFAIFAAAAVGAGWLGVALDRANGLDLANGVALSDSSGTSGQAIFILGPAIVALLLFFLSRDGAGPLGFTLRFPHRARWFAGAAVLYPVMTVVAVGAGVLAGRAALTWTPEPGKPSLIAAVGAIFALQVVKNLVEEFIFRGYGTRTAMALGLPGRVTPHLLVGVVWALWHLPLYLVWTSRADMDLITSLSWPLFLTMFLVGVVASAVVYGELRVRTGSLWPGVLLHSVCNAVATPLIANGHLSFTGHGDAFFSPVPGSLIIAVLFGAVAVWLVRRASPAPVPAPATPVGVTPAGLS